MSVLPIKPAWMDPNATAFITLHCTASAFGSNVTAEAISAMDQRRFGQTSYHYVIERSGKLVQTLQHSQRGAHVGGHNTHNLGISYVGGLDRTGRPQDTRTPEQLAALEGIVRKLHAQYPHARIMGHRDWSPDTNHDGIIEPCEWIKACPCFDVKQWLAKIGLAV